MADVLLAPDHLVVMKEGWKVSVILQIHDWEL